MHYPRYRFDLRFDSTAQAAAEAAAVEAAPEPEPVDPLDLPTHSERALRAAVAAAELRAFADGAEQGRVEGEAEAAARIEASLAQALHRLDEQLGSLDDRFAETLRGVEAQGAAVMVALVRRIAPRLLAQVGRQEAEYLAQEALRLAGKSPILRLNVHPDLAEAVRDRLAKGAGTGFAGTLDIVADRSMPPGGIDAAWEAGGMRYDPAAVEQAVATLCERSFAALLDTSTHTDTESTASWPH